MCAYCGRRVPADTITLDHVAPRRGRSAYDRRDNLVLACQECNGAKADMPILAFLLRNRTRAVMLHRFGPHLSPMLVELVRSLTPEGDVALPPQERGAARERLRHLPDVDREEEQRDEQGRYRRLGIAHDLAHGAPAE